MAERQRRRRLFDSEASCEAYLVARFLADGSPCPHCAGSSGKWIATRNVWQCCKCRKQVSVRADTVMARSRLKLLTWFLVIETLLQNPAASTAELATASGIRRAGTVRRMATRIRQAMNCPERSALLAGLDRLLGAANDSPAEPSVSD